MITRGAIAKSSALIVLAVLTLAGAVGLCVYTASSSVGSSTVSTTSQAGTNSTPPGPAGACLRNAQGLCTLPQSAWADYLGFIPAGYPLAPHYPNAPVYPCSSGLNTQQRTRFKASCVNGVCDPNESCATCPVDCGISGQLSCDPYTGRPGAPISVCQVGQIS